MEAPKILKTVMEVKKSIEKAYENQKSTHTMSLHQKQLEFLKKLLQTSLPHNDIFDECLHLNIPTEGEYQIIYIRMAIYDSRKDGIKTTASLLDIVVTIVESYFKNLQSAYIVFRLRGLALYVLFTICLIR